MNFDWSQGPLAEGLRCYRSQRFWHAHEHWEAVWLQVEGQEKMLLQALIQTTAAFHHLQRGNLIGTASLLRAALKRLEPLPDPFCGIAVDGLRKSLCMWLKVLEERTSLEGIPFPHIG